MSVTKEAILAKIDSIDKRIESLNQEIQKNYAHSFEWGVSLTLYGYMCEKEMLNEVITAMDVNGVTIQQIIDYWGEQILNGKFTENSTNQFRNIAYTKRKEVMAKTRKFLLYGF